MTVLRDGMLIGTLAQEEMKPDVIKSMMVGRELIGDYYRGDFDGQYGEKVVLNIENVTDGRILKMSVFQLHEGEILGLGGLTDSGMHELGRIAFRG